LASRTLQAAALAFAGVAAACGGESSAPSGPPVTPVYSPESGKLEQIVSDTDGDGKVDTRAFMDGRRLQRIEIDRNGDGRTDRWEYYVEAPPERVRSNAPDGRAEIDRVEEADGPDDRITRREFYQKGELARVEDDSNLDGIVDRWEVFEKGVLSRVELDSHSKGAPDRRLIYRKDGSIDRIEVDPDGSGAWHEASASAGRPR
jgi:hypothetical protein